MHTCLQGVKKTSSAYHKNRNPKRKAGSPPNPTTTTIITTNTSMAEPGSKATYSDGAPSHHTVFIDTNLGTHLVLLVSSLDTVSDLKKKILLEHKLCFPTNGDIKIHALKVKRRGFFYHLSESMFVHHVFYGAKKNYFISVDASNIEENNDNRVAVNRDSTNQVAQVGTAKNVSTDGDNILLDSYPESVSNVDLSLPLDESTQLVKEKASVSDQLRVDAAGEEEEEEEEELNNLKLFEYTGDHHSKVTSLDDDNDRLGPPIQDKHDEHSKDNGGNSRNEIGDVQGSAPSEVLETGSDAKKKHKKKRKNKDEINDVALKESNASVCESGENGLQQETSAKKKRKIEESNGSESSVIENGILISDFNKEASRQPTISENHLGNNQKNMHAVLDCLSTENLDGVNVPSACPSSGKRKKKKKSANPIYQETAGVPSSTEDVTDNPKDFGKEPDTALISYQHVQGVTISESCAVSSKEQHVDPVQGDTRPSSQEIGMRDANAGNAKSSLDAAEIPAPSAVLRRNSKNIILNDNEKPAAEQKRGCKEERVLLQPESIPKEKCKPPAQNETEMRSEAAVVTSLAEASETVNPGTLSKKRKKSKKTRDLLIGTPTSGTEPVKSSVGVDAALTEPHKDADRDDSNNKGNPEKSNLVANKGKEISKMDKEVVVTTEVEASETVNPGTLSKKRKKSKRTRDSLSGTLTAGTEHVKGSVADASTEPHKAVNGDDSSDKCNPEESNLLAKEGKAVTEMDKGVVASQLVEVCETVNPGTSSKKTRKSKRIRDLSSGTLTSGAEHIKGSVADASTEPHKAVNGDDSNDKGDKEESNILEMNGKSADVDTVRTFHLATDREIDDVIQNVVVSAVDDHPSKIVHADKVGQGMKVSCESDTINFNDYFVPGESRHKTDASGEVIVDKANKAKAAASDMKSDKKKKKLEAHSHGPSSDIHASPRLNENGGIVERPQPGKSGTIKLQESFPNATGENVMIPLHKKPSKVSGSGVKVPLSTKSDKMNYIPEEARISSLATTTVKNTHEKVNKEASDVSISSIESSRNRRAGEHVTHEKMNQMNGRKPRVSNVGEVLNFSQREKSLIGKSGSIFQDDNYGDFTDDGTDNSDDSTRTPSNSISSDYSDEESNSDSDSSQNGSYSSKTKEGGVKNIKKPFSSGMNLETILRSSSRYKKAKLTASQSLPEDTESQPVDFVPDSQANP